MTHFNHAHRKGLVHRLPVLIGFVAAFGLAACSGGGDEPDQPTNNAPVPNRAPVISSAADVTVAENTLEVFTVAASDADGDTLAFRLAGGDDAAFFEIDESTGTVSFIDGADFENPGDLDTDNVYDLVIAVDDPDGLSDEVAFMIAIENVPDTRFLESVFSQTRVSSDIRYATVDGEDLVLNIVEPVGDTETNRPFVLLANGGAFALTIREQIIPVAEAFARAGYMTAVMDYRTLGRAPSGFEFRAAAHIATQDMFGAIRFMRANADTYDIDPDRFIVGGASAGGTMALQAGHFDESDPITDELAQLLAETGGIFGTVGGNLDQSNAVQGIFSISAGLFGLEILDENGVVTYGAHNELDTVAPCGEIVSSAPISVSRTVAGTCAFTPVLQDLGVPADAFIVPDDTEHVDFTDEEFAEFLAEALQLYFDNVLPLE